MTMNTDELLGAAEVLVSVTGLEFAYTQAPKSMKSTVMGFWLLSIALGEFLIAPFIELSNWLASHLEKLGFHGLAVVTENGEMTKVTAANFFMFAGAMFVAGIGFLIIARRYKPMNFMEPADGATPSHS
jgi:POT family proton-dependent oligopeptide transporter